MPVEPLQKPLDAEQLDRLLSDWVGQGWLRDLDRALVVFLREQAPQACALSLLSAALVSHQLGRGHICLPLDHLLLDPDEVLSLPPEGAASDAPPALPSEVLRGLELTTWRAALERSPLVDGGEGDCPLVLADNRLYLRRYWQYEQQVATGIQQRLRTQLTPPTDLPARLETLFAPLCDDEERARRQIHWQTVAAALASRSAFTVISGGPGTGKTTTVVRLLGLLQAVALDGDSQRPLRVRLAAPTGKAAARLTESIAGALNQLDDRVRPHIPSQVTTLHRLLRPIAGSRQFRHHAGNPLHLDLLVVDEASMVDLEMMAFLLDALPPQARLILLGDKDQLASVEAGAVLGELCREADQPGYSSELVTWLHRQTDYNLADWCGDRGQLAEAIALLRKSHRFDAQSGIGQLAVAVNRGDTRASEAVWRAGYFDIGRIQLGEGEEGAFRRLVLEGETGQFPPGYESRVDGRGQPVPLPQGYRHYLQVLRDQRPHAEDAESCRRWVQGVLQAFGQFQVLSPLRQGEWGVLGLNQRIEAVLSDAGLIAPRGQLWYEGRPVLVTRNDYGLGLMNGDIGIALCDPLDQGRLRVFFADADGAIKRVLPSRLADVETVYSMTVHKSQGSEFAHTALLMPEQLSPVLTRELVYTGITRAKFWFTLAGPDLSLVNRAAQRQIRRASGLARLLAS